MPFSFRQRLALFFALAIFALASVSAQSAVLIVTNTNDSGPGSLRDTIAAASDGDTIQFDAALNGQAITLTSREISVEKNLTIDGPGADQLTVQRSSENGTPAFSIFYVLRNVTISGLTVANGNAPSPNSGGGIAFGAPGGGIALTIANCAFSGNSSPNYGGGLACGSAQGSSNRVNIINSTFSGNSATYGGAIDLGGPGFYATRRCEMTIVDSTITGNQSTSEGGGISNRGLLTVTTSTVSANESGNGGGIHNVGNLTIANSTISGNSASGEGGGIKSYGPTAVFTPGLLTMTNTTISGNSAGAGGGVHQPHVGRTFRNTIIASNTATDGPDLNGQLASDGFNLIGNNSGATISPAQTSDQIGTPASPIDPLLGPLQDNGGPTFTHALLKGSPALDQGESSGATTDQRGFDRPVDLPGIANAAGGDGADIGAFESASATLANISTRVLVGTGDNAMIGGFIITGTEQKTVIVRGIGPSLTVPGALANPTIEIYSGDGVLRGTNDNWNDAATRQEIIDSGLAPANNLESALWGVINPGAYTVVVRGKNDTTGIGLFEVYDLDQTVDSKLANISTRGLVQTGDSVMIGGFIVRGVDSQKVIIRALGPSLPVQGALANPTLELHDGNGALVAANDDWRSDQEAEIIATTIPPSNDLESAIVRSLAPGNYTAIVRDLNDTTGVGLVEVYALD